jgi:dihydrolipoamide dehydrogenase
MNYLKNTKCQQTLKRFQKLTIQSPEAIEGVKTLYLTSKFGHTLPLACDWAQEGRNVVLFERDVLGGSCVNYGCTPSKAFLGAAHAAGRARQAEKLGIHVQVSVDFPAVMERVRSIRDRFNHGVQERLEKAGVRVVCAEASLTGERIVTGGDISVQAPIVVINTGTSSFIPDLPGLAGTPHLTNRNFFELRALPPRLLVIGGGYIGLELGQRLARLGSQTQLIVRGDRVLDREAPEASEVLVQALEQDGIQFHFNTSVETVAYTDGVFIR